MISIISALEEIKGNIRRAQAASPLAARQVQLLAVSKTQPVARIEEAALAGQLLFAENRVQELLEKYQALPHLQWHLIGHLQTNKVKYMVDKVQMLHSLERIELAYELQKRLAAIGRVLPVLVQVNIAEEDSKFGLKAAEVADFLDAMADFPALCVRGLMTIGPFTDTAEEIRPVFRELRRILLREQKRQLPHVNLLHLSMGMSNDYTIAVEEGADIVRVGSSIFGSRS
ncbi:MAG: YggS family pyridoxal phosphate-dependent enzyme [Clostridiales bacterium]|nr:YggS family pyridoxal phosphate-dependent enzyme [Clostridiales bacterium]